MFMKENIVRKREGKWINKGSFASEKKLVLM